MEPSAIRSGVRKALEEAIAWCSLQPLTARPVETEEIRRQRELWLRANALAWDSYRKTGHGSKEADELNRQVNYRSLILLSDQLRSPLLTPGIEIGESVEDSQRIRTVKDLIMKRRELLASRKATGPTLLGEIGKLLVFFPNENLADGAAEYSSNGFFDANNTPPWDTWFHFDGEKLFSWVPDDLIPLADEGVSANPEECIRWLEWAELNELDA